MRLFPTLLLITILCSSFSALAQKNTLSVGAFGIPLIEDNVILGSVAYYRPVLGKHVLGLRGTYYTNAIGAKSDAIHFSSANVDLVHRWTLARANRRFKWHLEAGLSAAWTVEKLPPMGKLYYCGTGLTKEELEEMERYYKEVLSKWQVNRAFYPGISTAATWEISVSDHFGLGAGLMFNTYFSPQFGWSILPAPNLNASYTF